MHLTIRRSLAAALTAAALASSGCVVAAVAVGAAAAYGVIRYTENEAYRDCRGSLGEVWRATLGALKDNGYAVDETTPHGATEGRIAINDAKVVVDVQPGGLVRVHVRVGAFGSEDDRRRASLILESVGKRLE